MKPMNYALLITFVFFGMGCSNQDESKIDELTATEFRSGESQEPQLVSELLVHQFFQEQELSVLNCQRENILIDVENEIPGALEQLEQNQYQTELNFTISEGLAEEIAKKLPCPKNGCPKPGSGPNPCGEEKGCIFNCPILMPDRFSFITTTSNFDATIVNGAGEVCGEMGDIEQISEHHFEVPFETDGCCDAFLEITKELEYAPEGEFSYRLPITCEH